MARGILRPLTMLVVLSMALALAACDSEQGRPGSVLDEAMQAGRTAESFAAADDDYFREMDGGVGLTPEEVEGPQHLDRVDRRERPLLGRISTPASARSIS